MKQGDARVVKKKLWVALDIGSRQTFSERMKGKVEPRVSEAEAIERVFAEYGITDVWGVDETEKCGEAV